MNEDGTAKRTLSGGIAAGIVTMFFLLVTTQLSFGPNYTNFLRMVMIVWPFFLILNLMEYVRSLFGLFFSLVLSCNARVPALFRSSTLSELF